MLAQTGQEPIEQLRPGDKVLARNEQTGLESYQPILQTFATPKDELYDLALTGLAGPPETLTVTGNHPFWVKDKGWTESDLLEAGDLVSGKDGSWLTILSLKAKTERATGYNLEVQGDHTYFVGDSEAWVHNECGKVAESIADGAHTVFKRDRTTGRISHYETRVPQTNPQNPNLWQMEKRFDGQGPGHFNKITQQRVPTPHVHDPKTPGGVRPPTSDELPLGY